MNELYSYLIDISNGTLIVEKTKDNPEITIKAGESTALERRLRWRRNFSI